MSDAAPFASGPPGQASSLCGILSCHSGDTRMQSETANDRGNGGSSSTTPFRIWVAEQAVEPITKISVYPFLAVLAPCPLLRPLHLDMRAPEKRRAICFSRGKTVYNAFYWSSQSKVMFSHVVVFWPVHKHLKSFILCTAIMQVVIRQATHIMSRDHMRRSAVDRFL